MILLCYPECIYTYIACVLVYLDGKFLAVELLVERINAFKIVMNIAKLFPLEKRSTSTRSQPQWKKTGYISERLCIRDENVGKLQKPGCSTACPSVDAHG